MKYVFHRVGSLNLTKRWSDERIPVVRDWQNEDVQEIQFSTGFKSYQVAVRLACWQDGDSRGRFYTPASGTPVWVDLPPYAVSDPEAFWAHMDSQLPNDAIEWASSCSLPEVSERRIVYCELLRLIPVNSDAQDMISQLIQLEYCRWLKTGSANIVGGNKLGIAPVPDDACTMPGKVPLPRLITAQIDIMLSRKLEQLLNDLFRSSEELELLSPACGAFQLHTAYVVVDALVRGTVWILKDMKRRRGENSGAVELVKGINEEASEIQRSLNSIIFRLNQKLTCFQFEDLIELLTEKERTYHSQILEGSAVSFKDEWENPRFWLPPIKTMCEGIAPHQVFSL